MITFDPLWEMLEERGITIYDLEYDYELNPAEISRLKNEHNFTLMFINRLCKMFKCQTWDIIKYINEDETETTNTGHKGDIP